MLRRPSAPSDPGARRWSTALPRLSVLLGMTLAGPLGAQPAAPPTPTPAPASTQAPTGQELDDLPDIGLAWPDLNKQSPAPAEPAPNAPPPAAPDQSAPAASPAPPVAQAPDESGPDEASVASEEDSALLATIDPTAPLRYATSIDGLGDAADNLLHERFDALSALKAGEGKSANIAQIRRRGRADATMLDDLLRVRGYFDSRSRLDLRPAGSATDRINAVLVANPGAVYTLGEVDVDGLSASDPREVALRKLFDVKVGDPADTDRIKAATDALRVGLLDGGYPFGEVRDPVLVVDHERRSSALNTTVTTGGFRRVGNIMVNKEAPFDAKHIAVIARFKPGDTYKQTDIADLNRALVATGLVSQVAITPQPGPSDEIVDLAVSLGKAPVHTIASEIGYGTGEGARIEASWQHRNLFPPEGALTVRGVLGQQEQSLTTTFRRANFGKRDQVLNGEISFANLDQPAYQAVTFGVSGSIERQTNLIFQKDWVWSLGGEVRLSDERDLYGADLTPRRRQYVIVALPSSITYDGSDDLLDPRKGFRLGGRISPELSLQGGAFGYVRAQADGSFYLQASKRVTIAGRARLGTILGASSDRIAPTRRYYAGGGGSVRGYGYQAIGPRDLNNAPVGGRSLGELSLEARFRFGSMDQFGLVPFIDAGTISTDPWPSIREMRVGAGMGFRYYSNFGPVRIDVGTPLNPQPGDSRIGVYVSLGQAF